MVMAKCVVSAKVLQNRYHSLDVYDCLVIAAVLQTFLFNFVVFTMPQILNLAHNKSEIERRVHAVIDKFAERGLRSLAVAYQVKNCCPGCIPISFDSCHTFLARSLKTRCQSSRLSG